MKRASSATTKPRAPRRKATPDPKLVAAYNIQTYWRKNFSKQTTVDLVSKVREDFNFTPDHVKAISFEALVVFLREKPVIAAMKGALQRIHYITTCLHGSPSKHMMPENVNVRVFLAAYMIVYRSSHVFESMGTLEQALFESAVPLLNTFHEICSKIMEAKTAGEKTNFTSIVPTSLSKEFPTLLFEYLKRFKAWKTPDEAKLLCRIKHALVALYQAESHLPPDEPEDSKLKIEFKTQIVRLREKLSQLGGPEALEKFNADYSAGILPNTPATGGSGNGAYSALPGRMTNEQLAHELLLDPAFVLHENGGCDLDNPVFLRVRESFHNAFWSSLTDDLKLATPCYTRVIRVLIEVRDGIKDLAGESEAGNINEVIDAEHIKERVEAGNYTFVDAASMFRSIVGIIQRIQSPRRDTETKERWKELEEKIATATVENGAEVTCKVLEFLLGRVNALRIDAANARLRLIAPVIKDHGVDYERGKFADKIRDGTLTTERTTAWLHTTLDSAAGLADQVRAGSTVAALDLHAIAMISLINTTENIAVTAEKVQSIATDLFRDNRLSAAVITPSNDDKAVADLLSFS